MTLDMRLSWDEAKRVRTLMARELDFVDARLVFGGPTLEFIDNRKDYGEQRIICVGFLRGRMVVTIYVQRGAVRRIISMRRANDREQKIYRSRLARS